MNVTFTRTGERRYRISVEGKGVVSSYMEPAAGYDARLPHAVAHFVVESYLGLNGAVFGRLAAGGHQFSPTVDNVRKGLKQTDKISAQGRAEAEFAERVIDIACKNWNQEPYTGAPAQGVTTQDITNICAEYGSVWSKLPVGGSMTFEWKPKVKSQKTARRR